jgi:thiosulfate dehydrogenase (quinone) large subunit
MDQNLSETRQSMMRTPLAPGAALGRTAPIITPATGVGSRSLTRETAVRYVWAVTRLCMGWVFLWPFLDKMISGGNPTKGFLSGSVGAFSGFYQSIAGAGVVNWLFMVGLIVIAAGLLLGIFMRFACAAGAVMVLLMWSASLPPQDDLFMDNHIIYALLLIALALVGAGNTLGIGRWWAQTNLVQRFAWLR